MINIHRAKSAVNVAEHLTTMMIMNRILTANMKKHGTTVYGLVRKEKWCKNGGNA
jgi:hypothetical protein